MKFNGPRWFFFPFPYTIKHSNKPITCSYTRQRKLVEQNILKQQGIAPIHHDWNNLKSNIARILLSFKQNSDYLSHLKTEPVIKSKPERNCFKKTTLPHKLPANKINTVPGVYSSYIKLNTKTRGETQFKTSFQKVRSWHCAYKWLLHVFNWVENLGGLSVGFLEAGLR